MKTINNGQPSIQIDNVSKIFKGNRVVNNLSLEVKSGEIFGFLGLNGAGKTTTIKMLLSLLKPSSGSLYMLGSKVASRNYWLWDKVGYLENAACYPGLTVMENLEIARRSQMIPDHKATDQIIHKLGLDAHKNKKAKNLSLGNRQRLGLAKAMIHNPEILILDEPVNGLDPAGVVEIRETLLDLSKNHGVTIFISSHLLEELAKLVDRVGIIHEGHLVQNINMTYLEQSLQKRLIVKGRNKKALMHVLKKHGYDFIEMADEGLGLTAQHVIERPETLAALLVNANQPPVQLHTVTEDLESYFLRVIQNERRNNR